MFGIDPVFAFGISLVGAVMGLATTFIGLPKGREPLVWMGFYVVWVALAVWLSPVDPLPTVFVGSVLSGVWAGGIQALFPDRYEARNPWYKDELAKWGEHKTRRFVQQGVMLGAGFGVVVGLVAWAAVAYL